MKDFNLEKFRKELSNFLQENGVYLEIDVNLGSWNQADEHHISLCSLASGVEYANLGRTLE